MVSSVSVAGERTGAEVVKNVTCPYCGLLCDDIDVYLEDGEISRIKRGCGLSNAKFVSEADRIESPAVREGEELHEVSYGEAIERAAEVLREAKRPDCYGWSSCSVEAQGLGIELMKEARGSIGSTSAVCHLPSVLAMQDCGAPKATLEQVRNRADVVIYWGSNPVEAHPRHFERVTRRADGYFVKGKDRYIAVVDVRETLSAKISDEFVKVEPGGDYEALQAMRSMLQGNEIEADEVGGVPVETLGELLGRMKDADFACIFWGLGVTMSGAKHRNVEALTSLAKELNDYGRCVSVPMRGHFNVAGFGQVCTWKTGFPGFVDFTGDEINYAPGENTSVDLLRRGGSDAMLLVGSDPAAHFPLRAVKRLREVPVVQVDPHPNATTRFADVVIPSALVGIEAEGTAYRMDTVPIRLKKVVDPPEGVRTDERIIRDVMGAL
ncbi:MAG: Assimilatory nitrate reductase [Methanonatronarchaeales archaeon]|nr:Assimilatory nitrate reductase [Methanonatronarchaeales archaeon]